MHYVLYLGNYTQKYYRGANLNIKNGRWDYVINKIVLNKQKSAGFKINKEPLFFARDDLEFHGIKISRQGIMPLPNKVEAINSIAVPTNKKQLRSFIGGDLLITVEICGKADQIF